MNNMTPGPLNGNSIIQDDTTIEGELRTDASLELLGYVDGVIKAGEILIGPSGRAFGRIQADSADIHGIVQGDISVRDLIQIRSSGSVSGNVRYGQLAMEQGGDLSADVRNVPPRLAGDFDITVRRGGSVVVTPEDLSALDPDDSDDALTFSIKWSEGGVLELSERPGETALAFTLADIKSGKVRFVHDGSEGSGASFIVDVSDDDGASSGSPQAVIVNVSG